MQFPCFSYEGRLQIALDGISRHKQLMSCINYFELSEDDRFRIAEACIDAFLFSAFEDLDRFQLGEENQYKLALIALQKDAGKLAYSMNKFQLSGEHFSQIAAQLIEREYAHELFSHFPTNLEPQLKQKIFFAEALKDPDIIQQIFRVFNLKDPSDYIFSNEFLTEEMIEDIYACPKFRERWDKVRTEYKAWVQKDFPLPECNWALEGVDRPQSSREFRKMLQARLIFLAILKAKGLSTDQFKMLNECGLIKAVFDLRTPHLRCLFTLMIADIACSENASALFKTKAFFLRSPETYSWHGPLLRASLSLLQDQGVEIKGLLECLKGTAFRTFKDVRKFVCLLTALQLLQRSTDLSAEEKSEILKKLVKNPAKIYQAVQNLFIILELKEDLILRDPKKELDQMAFECVQKRLPPGSIGSIEEWHDTFPNPLEIMVYSSKMASLGEDRVDLLGAFLKSICMKTFEATRYDNEYFNQHPAELEAWRKGITLPMSEVMKQLPPEALSPGVFDARKWMKRQLLDDQHMDLRSFGPLQRYLSLDDSNLQDQIENEIANKSSRARTAEEKVMFYCIGLAKATTKEEQIDNLNKLTRCECNSFYDSEFLKHLQKQLSILTKATEDVDLAAFTISEGDNWLDIFSCGKVGTSCQHFNGNAHLNQGLLGYLLNGQTRIIGIKDREGKMVARCLIRYYLDETGKPVLFLSRYYSNVFDPRMEAAIEHVAKMKAKEMGLVLTSLDGGALYGKRLKSLTGKALEYFDEARGVQYNGNATVVDARIIT